MHGYSIRLDISDTPAVSKYRIILTPLWFLMLCFSFQKVFIYFVLLVSSQDICIYYCITSDINTNITENRTHHVYQLIIS